MIRPVHDVGLPLLFAPIARVLAPASGWLAARAPERWMRRLRLSPTGPYRHLIEAIFAVLGGWLACLIFQTLTGAGVERRTAFWSALLAALSPPLLIHSILFFADFASAVLCLLAFQRLAPIFIVAGAGLVAMRRTHPALAWKIAVAAGGYLALVLLPLTNVHGWTGGRSPPARFWVPIVPLLALGLPSGFRVMPRSVAVSLVVLQVAVNAAVCQRSGWAMCSYLPAVPH